MDNDVNNREGYLYLLGARGYSAYEVAVQNGFVGTEEEWLASLKGDKGDTGDTFDELTPEQKAEIKGDTGKSAYEIAVEHGFIGTEQDWVNAYLSPDGYIRNADVVDNLESTETDVPLSANQGKVLKEDIDDINEKVRFLFPKFMPDAFSGDSNLIKYGDINILIDSNLSTLWSYIKDFLDDNDATHIDYFILTHYDGDHYGNINNLITNGYLDSDTEVFLPIVPDNFSDKQTTETTVKAALTTAGIEFRTPTEKEQIIIGKDLKVTFGNLNKTYMESNYTQYNATSMVCLIEHKNINAFYAGDAFYQTYQYLYGINFITQTIDLYKQPHHGIDMSMPFILFTRQMSPSHTVQTGGSKDFAKNNFYCEETSFLIEQGTRYYPCYMQTDYIEFESNGKTLNCISGTTGSFSGKMGYLSFYVDINASLNEIQDGTQEHPFSELMQAIGYIKNFPSGHYRIYLADGNYGYSHEAGATHEKNSIQIELDGNCVVEIRGNDNDRTAVMLNGMRCYGAHIRLFNLALDTKNRDGIQLMKTALTATNILITSSDPSQVHTGILVQEGSAVKITNSKIEYCNKGIRATGASQVTYDNVVFENITQKNIDSNSGDSHIQYKDIKLSGEGSTVLLKDDYKNYDWIEIVYRTNDYIRNSVKIVSPDDDYRITADVAYTNPSGSTYDKKALFNLKDGDKITITNMYQTTIENNNLTVTALSEGAFVINKVYAGYHG